MKEEARPAASPTEIITGTMFSLVYAMITPPKKFAQKNTTEPHMRIFE